MDVLNALAIFKNFVKLGFILQLQMAIAMMKLILLGAIMMEETAVDLAL